MKWAFVFQQAYFTGLLSTFSICFVKLVVFSHKPCWPSPGSPSGYATDGGFPFQMKALSELFDETRVLVPCYPQGIATGEIALVGQNLHIVPLSPRHGAGMNSKLNFLPWLMRNSSTILRELRQADAVHTPIPGDVGTVGMLGACFFRKPLLVRHCGNWLQPVTLAEKFWCWFMETFAGGRNVMLATGGALEPPSRKNSNVQWIFSSSLTQNELAGQARPRQHPPNGQLRLIHVARQEKAKGAGTVIQSLPLLARRFSGVSFEIVGEGFAILEFKKLAAGAGVGGRVHFSGKLNHEQVMHRLQDAHLFTFPTTSSDGFPKSVLEALASGLPVVATPVSVLPRLLGNGCGVLVHEATPVAVAQGIEQALSNPAQYEAMSRKAIETARQFSLEAWRDRIGGMLTKAWGPLKAEESRNQKSVVSGPVVP